MFCIGWSLAGYICREFCYWAFIFLVHIIAIVFKVLFHLLAICFGILGTY
jgi:hypothetical protein